MNVFDYNTPLRPLSDTKAVEVGANFLSEIIIFGVAAGTIIGETYRAQHNKTVKRNEMEDDIEDLKQTIEELENLITAQSFSIEMLCGQNKEFESRLASFQKLLNKL
jgi:succinate dehydrogenase/fumarate reductase flavoprotein subunit